MNSFVIVITGSDMDKISNEVFKLTVNSGFRHDFVLNEFMKDNDVKYYGSDFPFACDAVKLAAMGSIVLLLGNSAHILVFPAEINKFQFDELSKFKELFVSEDVLVSIMNIKRVDDNLLYEGISSSCAMNEYDRLVSSKLELGQSKIKQI